jgi:hypothetical protein
VRLGLGYTVYKRSADGVPVRIDPSAPLVDGDAIRVVLESNVDGYLYIFNTDSANQNAAMIYPQLRLAGGENYVAAHVPVEVPSRHEPNPGNQWLILSGGPTVDRLYFVVSERPLAGVPTGDALRRFCGENRNCYWEPSARDWAGLGIRVSADVRVAASSRYGQAMTTDEADAVEGRAVRLGPEAPAPAAVAIGASSNVHVVIAAVDLAHRSRS